MKTYSYHKTLVWNTSPFGGGQGGGFTVLSNPDKYGTGSNEF